MPSRLNELGARVRLVKGRLQRAESVAYQDKADVDAAFVEIMQLLLAGGNYPAIATHDPGDDCRDAQHLRHSAAFAPDRYRIPDALRGPPRSPGAVCGADGYRVRVYVPFGREWFPYFMRRLGERPANVGFVLSGILRER